jgi:minor histocompatibility antigen H13
MYFFNAAQPALLYLVPACLGASLTTGFLRGELSFLFAYDEETKVKETTAVSSTTTTSVVDDSSSSSSENNVAKKMSTGLKEYKSE